MNSVGGWVGFDENYNSQIITIFDMTFSLKKKESLFLTELESSAVPLVQSL